MRRLTIGDRVIDRDASGRPFKGEQVKAQVRDLCDLIGVPIETRAVGLATYGEGPKARRVMHGKKGQADLTGTLPGGIRLEIEAKAWGELPRPEQMQAILGASAHGAVAFWVDCVVMAHVAIAAAMQGLAIHYVNRTEAIAQERGLPAPAYAWPQQHGR